MGRSVTKIRNIQEMNRRLEKRMLNESNSLNKKTLIKEEDNSTVNDLIMSLKDDLDKMAMKNDITVEDVCNQLIDICEEIKEYAKKSGPSDFENINAFGL